MSIARQVAHNTIIQVVSKVVSTALGLFALALITRALGLGGFGDYTTITTFLTFFAVIADLGLTLITVQMISSGQNDERRTLNNLFGLRLVSIILIMAAAPAIAFFSPYSPIIKSGIIIGLFSFIFPALNQIIIGLFQKKLSMGRDAAAEIIGRLVLIAGIVVSQKMQAGLSGILIVLSIAAGINFLVHYFLALKFAVIRPEFDWSVWKKILTKSWPLAITIVLNLIYLRADTLILSFFRSSEEVGLYGAAYKIIDVLTTLPFMFAGLILPIITTAWNEGRKDYFQKVLQKSFDLMAIAALPLVVGAQFLGQPIITLVAGDEFAPAGKIIGLLIFAVAAIFLGTMFSHAVIAIDKQKKMVGFYLFTSLSALAAYLFLIPRFSYFGAAAVTIYSEAMIAIFSAVCVYKYSRFRPRFAGLGKSAAASLIMAALLYFFPVSPQDSWARLLLVLAAAALAYLLALYLFGGIKKSDLKTIFKNQDKSGGQTYGNESNL